MNLLKLWKSIAMCVGVIAVVFTLASVFDIILAFFHRRFYSNLAFIVIFGVAGIFAAVFSYTYAIQVAPAKSELARWTVIVTNIIIGSLFFFLLSELEGGEYEPAFKAFGITVALANLLFTKGKVEL